MANLEVTGFNKNCFRLALVACFRSLFHYSCLFIIIDCVKFCYITFCCCLHHLAPSAPPQAVSGRPLTDNSILVEWRPPPDDQRNGLILGYRVFYLKSEENLSDKDAQSVEVDRTEATLTGLDTWTEYKIWVLGYTMTGESPQSMPIFVKTHESGRYFEQMMMPLSTNLLTYVENFKTCIVASCLYLGLWLIPFLIQIFRMSNNNVTVYCASSVWN